MENKCKENHSNITAVIEELGEVEEMLRDTKYSSTINNTLKLLFNVARHFQVKENYNVIVTMSSAKYKEYLKFLENESV